MLTVVFQYADVNYFNCYFKWKSL